MNTARSTPPRFLWQGLLILLPVAVLAVVGFVSLRKDKMLVQTEAAERAQVFADEFAETLWEELVSWNDDEFLPSFTVAGDGGLLDPPPVPLVPIPQPYDLARLTPEQLELWRIFNTSAGIAPTSSNRLAATRAFLSSRPPERLAAAAQFALALQLSRVDHVGARAALDQIARKYPNVSGETGIPFEPLALLKRIELMPAGSTERFMSAWSLGHKVIQNPSTVTPLIHARLRVLVGKSNTIETWERMWQLHNLSRELFAAAGLPPAVKRPRLFWFTNSLPASATNPPVPWLTTKPIFANSDTIHTTNVPLPASATRMLHPPAEERWLATRASVDPCCSTRYVCKKDLNQRLASVFAPAAGDDSATVVATLSAIVSTPTNPWPQFAAHSSAASSPQLRTLAKLVSRLPDYFGLSVQVAGHPLISSNHLPVIGLVGGGKGSGHTYLMQHPDKAPPLLATARKFDEGVEYLRVGVHLVSADMLYSRQKTRVALFGLLIMISAGAAVVGFVSARRAFLRQQALSDMKSNFVSSVSHELRAPIASVRLMAESLERGKISEPAKQHEYFRFIVQECRRLGSLIENVLDFALIEQGRKQYEFEPTDLPALLRQTVKLMEPRAAEREVTLDLQIPADAFATPESQPILDGAAIQQALINLLDNAIKHSPPAGTVTVSLTCVPPQPAAVVASFSILNSKFLIHLSVHDTGPGIAPEEHEKIFERFYRCGSELRRETQGVGIGLSIVKHIAEAHGGSVRVESAVGKGSCFVLELPLPPKRVKA